VQGIHADERIFHVRILRGGLCILCFNWTLVEVLEKGLRGVFGRGILSGGCLKENLEVSYVFVVLRCVFLEDSGSTQDYVCS